MSIGYQLVEDGPLKNVVAFFPDKDEPIRSADSNHPHWTAILEGLQSNDPDTYTLFDVWGGIKSKFMALSERVEYDGTNILFDGDVINNELSAQIHRFLDAGLSDWEPLVKFWEKVEQNPSEHSKENLYRWLRTHDFSITMDGDIVAYKGVRTDLTSSHAGPAVVDGAPVNGHIPNQPGSVITMARSEVTANPSIGCHVGLHVGTWSYASTFADVTLEVHVHPRDVVSVPTDCGDEKMRVCRYRVVQVRGKAYDGPLLPTEDYESLEEFEESWDGDVGYDPRDI